jgi:hypothetical protein
VARAAATAAAADIVALGMAGSGKGIEENRSWDLGFRIGLLALGCAGLSNECLCDRGALRQCAVPDFGMEKFVTRGFL